MKYSSLHYDRDCLQQLLDDALHEPLSTQVAEHIADCSGCRQRLESLAGEPQWWSRACGGIQAILAEPHAAEDKTLKMDMMGWVCFDVVPLSWHNISTDDAQKAKKQLLESLYRTTEVESLPSSNLKDNFYAFFPKPVVVRD